MQSRELTWGPLPAAEYAIGIPRRGLQGTVDLPASGTTFTLR